MSDSATILFADVAGSTSLYEQLGDEKARRLVGRCVAAVSAVVQQAGGRVVKTIGDEVMAVFPVPEAAVKAAVAAQETVTGEGELAACGIRLRVGLHHGPVIHEAGDVFGDAVNLAARVAAQAKADQILTTGATLALAGEAAAGARLVDRTRVKGKQQPVELYELAWGAVEEMTMVGGTADLIDGAPAGDLRLTVTAGGHSWTVAPERPTLSFGRGNANDIVIDDRRVSRLHGRIELQRDRFVLVDHSTNGTWLQPDGEDGRLVRRDQIRLPGRGRLVPGHAGPADDLPALFFHTR